MSTFIKECECAGGECSAPVSTPPTSLESVPGMGNAQPAKMAAMTGADQTSKDCIGSGDKWTGFGDSKKKKKYKIGVAKQKGVEVIKTMESLEEAKKELKEIIKTYTDAKIYQLD